MGAIPVTPNLVSASFDTIASTYDDTFSNSPIGRAQRRTVWKEMDRVFQPGQRILEINCGTGIDAVHMALRGIHVDACDASPGMIAHADRLANTVTPRGSLRFQCLQTEAIDALQADPPYDGVLSNFSGLNCISDLQPVAKTLSKLVRPGGRVILCVFGTFCLWEVLWYIAAGDFRKACRRFHRHGVDAALTPTATITVHYRSVDFIRNTFAPDFRLERTQGVGVVVPPSYAAPLASRFPHLFRVAARVDPILGRFPIARSVADHVLLTLQRTKESTS